MGKNQVVIAEFSIIPLGQSGTSLSHYVAEAVEALRKVKNLNFEVTAMGTILEAESLDTIFEAVRQSHKALFALGVQRVSSTLRIDDRKDKARSMNDKVRAVKETLA